MRFHRRPRLTPHALRLTSAVACATAFGFFLFASAAVAHPLGNFSINHFSRLEPGVERIGVRYVVDLAEIPAFQALQTADTDGDGTASAAELDAYLELVAARYADGLRLTVDGQRIPRAREKQHMAQVRSPNGSTTLRIELDFGAADSAALGTHRLRFDDGNDADRIGWREIMVEPPPGVTVFDSSAFGNGLSNELRFYPADLLAAPLAETAAELSFTSGPVPAGATPLRTRDGHQTPAARDRFVELIGAPSLTPVGALVALLMAVVLGGLHALAPGHGKTVVGAYLVGARGTARHAAFLGLTVTITHTAGVFALGLITLFASEYVLPERVLPALSLASGALVLGMGVSLLTARLRALGTPSSLQGAAGDPREHLLGDHSHHGDYVHHHHHDHHHHEHHRPNGHAHDGDHRHSHLPPGADGAPITWRGLLALGVSGGIVPCPSALVVLLAAVSLHRIGFGLLLIVAFSAGLATALTAVGLAFVYGGRFAAFDSARAGALTRVLPVLSALVVSVVGAAICYEALAQSGFGAALAGSLGDTAFLSTASLLGFGFVIGLKHALEADHVAAVSTIVSERASVLSSSIIGGFWGLGHTLSLLAAGAVVLFFHVEISERTAQLLELAVALMLIGLGLNGLRKLVWGARAHWHLHGHGAHVHFHPHAHDHIADGRSVHHHALRLGARPLLVGIVHGLAGSAALMLVVLSTIRSPLVGLAYIGAFGVGSIGGMICMSALLGLPVYLTARRFERATVAVRTLAALLSLATGLLMAWEIGIGGS